MDISVVTNYLINMERLDKSKFIPLSESMTKFDPTDYSWFIELKSGETFVAHKDYKEDGCMATCKAYPRKDIKTEERLDLDEKTKAWYKPIEPSELIPDVSADEFLPRKICMSLEASLPDNHPAKSKNWYGYFITSSIFTDPKQINVYKLTQPVQRKMQVIQGQEELPHFLCRAYLKKDFPFFADDAFSDAVIEIMPYPTWVELFCTVMHNNGLMTEIEKKYRIDLVQGKLQSFKRVTSTTAITQSMSLEEYTKMVQSGESERKEPEVVAPSSEQSLSESPAEPPQELTKPPYEEVVSPEVPDPTQAGMTNLEKMTDNGVKGRLYHPDTIEMNMRREALHRQMIFLHNLISEAWQRGMTPLSLYMNGEVPMVQLHPTLELLYDPTDRDESNIFDNEGGEAQCDAIPENENAQGNNEDSKSVYIDENQHRLPPIETQFQEPKFYKNMEEARDDMGIDRLLNNIIAGDCRVVMKLIPDESIGMIMTDPPYYTRDEIKQGRSGHGKSTGMKDMKKDIGDWDEQWESEEDYYAWCLEWMLECQRVLMDDRHFVCFTDFKKCTDMINVGEMAGFRFRSPLFWIKSNPTPKATGISFQRAVEVALWFTKGKCLKEHFNSKLGQSPEYVIAAKPTQNRIHTTEKPLKVPLYWINYLSHELDIFLDPFSGSGAFSVAANMLKRYFIGIERNKENFYKSHNRIFEKNEKSASDIVIFRGGQDKLFDTEVMDELKQK